MSINSIRQSLEVALNAWAIDNSVPIAWQNTPYSPSEGTFYIRPSLLPAETLNPTLGDSHNRKTGIFQLLIYAKDGTGSLDSEILADSLLNYFARGRSFIVNVLYYLDIQDINLESNLNYNFVSSIDSGNNAGVKFIATSSTANTITVRMLESPSVSPALNDGGWYITPVSIRYTVDLF